MDEQGFSERCSARDWNQHRLFARGEGPMRKPIKVLLALVAGVLLTSCASDGSSVTVGPSEESEPEESEPVVSPAPYLLELAIPVLDPGLPEDEYAATEDGIWPELRRAEANRMAWMLKMAADKSQSFSMVRVTPTAEVSADIYMLGEILKSNGEDLIFKIKVIDASGKTWYTEKYTHRNPDYWYEDLRNVGQDPFADLYTEPIDDLIAYLKKKKPDDIARIQEISRLRFAQSFAPDAFNSYLAVKRGKMVLLAAPAVDDPMVMRIDAIRVRDKLFIESFQGHYSTFASDMDEAYYLWQEDSGLQAGAVRRAKQVAALKTAVGVLLVVTGAVASDGSGDLGNLGANVAVIGGAVLVGSGIGNMMEARSHKEVLNELGNSINGDLGPRIIEMDSATTTLTGSAEEQFAQWRELLRQIYEAESMPVGTIKIVEPCTGTVNAEC